MTSCSEIDPPSLQSICIDFFLEYSYTTKYGCPHRGMVNQFRGGEIFLAPFLADDVLKRLTQKKLLKKETLEIFKSDVCSLHRVHIGNNNTLTSSDLRLFKSHKITNLEVSNVPSVTINSIIGCLSEWSLSNLRTLNVSGGTFFERNRMCIVVSLAKLQNLRCLDVCNTEFNDSALALVAQDLKCLESLNISCTVVSNLCHLKPLRKTLRCLAMYNMRAANGAEIANAVSELLNLEYLDISEDQSEVVLLADSKDEPSADVFIKNSCQWPKLKHLDISGRNGLTMDTLGAFLDNHDLQFLGLMFSSIGQDDRFTNTKHPKFNPKLKVSGMTSEAQLVVALNMYMNRAYYVQKLLCSMFGYTQTGASPNLEYIKPLLCSMKLFYRDLGVQLAATACAHNCCKKDLGLMLHPYWLQKIASYCMNAMANFPNHLQLQKNALLTLCNDRILQDVSFDRFRCAKLVLDCLCRFDDQHMKRMCVAICGIVAAKIPTSQTSQLGKNVLYMQKLLTIVRQKIDLKQDDLTLRFTLSALWNLTDESPDTCRSFKDEGGLDLFIELLQACKTRTDDAKTNVETKVLGLMNNLAEVADLRPLLMTSQVLDSVCSLLHSPCMDTSYFAAGILAHLLCECDDNIELDKDDVLQQLEDAIIGWQEPKGEMVAYRSFKPFIRLLQTNIPQIQLWAVWAMDHVCHKNGERYCNMLLTEGGAPYLEKLVHATDRPRVKDLSQRIMEQLCNQLGTLVVTAYCQTAREA